MKIHFHFFVFLLILFMSFGNNLTEGGIACGGILSGNYCPDLQACLKACKFFHSKDLILSECFPKVGCLCTYVNPDPTKPCPPHMIN
ncbi:uncharacterized protein DS421_18g610150 [Arachis hypogaea]|nr:uncharacterized protein DS421_18g610150 [Arachis hypogaea]